MEDSNKENQVTIDTKSNETKNTSDLGKNNDHVESNLAKENLEPENKVKTEKENQQDSGKESKTETENNVNKMKDTINPKKKLNNKNARLQTQNVIKRKFQSMKGNKNLIWNIIDYSIVIILIIAAYYFTQDVLNDYKNKRSSMSFEKRAIQEQPSISISFDGDPGKTIWKRKMYNLGTEINITYYKHTSTNYITLKEGDNVSPDFGGEIINLRRMQSCYVINVKSENYKHEENLERSIRIDFAPHLAEPGKYLDAYLQIGSEPNSFGAEKAIYKEGKVLRGLLWQDHFSNLIITTSKQQRLKELTNCKDESFWMAIEKAFVNEVKEMCPIPCSPQGFPTMILGMCETENSWKCSNYVLDEIITNRDDFYSSPCTTIDFEGYLQANLWMPNAMTIDGGPSTAIAKQWNGNPMILVTYSFEKPERETYNREYLVVDTFALIGKLGGNLGIFIGFEFFGFFCMLVDLFRNLLQGIIFRGKIPTGRKKSVWDNSWISIKTAIFLLLAIISIIFVEGIWMDFKEKKTSLIWDEEPIVDHPTFSVCFKSDDSDMNIMTRKMFSIGTDINITYSVNTKRTGPISIMLKEGKNKIPNVEDEAVLLQARISCYKLTHKSEHFEPIRAYESKIKIEFSRKFTEDQLAPCLMFYTTSEANSFGVEFNTFKNGNPLITHTCLNEHTSITIKPKMIQYLQDVRDGCEEKNIWSHVEERFIPEVKNTCPNHCTPFILPNNSITEICKTHFDFGCAAEIYMEALKEVKKSFTMPCNTIEYNDDGRTEHGKIIDGFPKLIKIGSFGQSEFKIPKDWEGKPTAIMSYKFDKPEKMTVRREFFNVDFESLVGLVGGTLSMFLGFAFTDTTFQLMDLINVIIYKIYNSKTSGQKITANKVQPSA